MRNIRTLILIIFISSHGLPAFAQADSTSKLLPDSARPSKKPLILSFGLDLNIESLAGSYNHDYTGEYNADGQGPDGWRWVHHKSAYNKIFPDGKLTNVKLSVMIANTKTFQLGLSYNFGFLDVTIPENNFDSATSTTQKTVDVSHSFVYAGISLMSEYNYYFNKKNWLGPFAFAGLDLGFYTGTDDLFGAGTPYYVQGRLGAGYDFKHDVVLKAFISTDNLIYREKSTSQIFQRSQTLNIDLNTLYIGIGISKMFTIIPD